MSICWQAPKEDEFFIWRQQFDFCRKRNCGISLFHFILFSLFIICSIFDCCIVLFGWFIFFIKNLFIIFTNPSRTLLSILADLNNPVVWMVSTRPFISKSSGPCTNHLVTVPRAPITIGIIVTFMIHSFFNSLTRSVIIIIIIIIIIITYPSTRAGYDTRSILRGVYRFEFRVFLLLD